MTAKPWQQQVIFNEMMSWWGPTCLVRIFI